LQEIQTKIKTFSQESFPTDTIPLLYRRCEKIISQVHGDVLVGGNTLKLLKDSPAFIESLREEIRKAKETIHISFYILLDDDDGISVLKELQNAAKRGVKCRILIDAFGSKKVTKNPVWKQMSDFGVEAHTIFPMKNILLSFLRQRNDIRSHRKMCIIDKHLCYF